MSTHKFLQTMHKFLSKYVTLFDLYLNFCFRHKHNKQQTINNILSRAHTKPSYWRRATLHLPPPIPPRSYGPERIREGCIRSSRLRFHPRSSVQHRHLLFNLFPLSLHQFSLSRFVSTISYSCLPLPLCKFLEKFQVPCLCSGFHGRKLVAVCQIWICCILVYCSRELVWVGTVSRFFF